MSVYYTCACIKCKTQIDAHTQGSGALMELRNARPLIEFMQRHAECREDDGICSIHFLSEYDDRYHEFNNESKDVP